MKACCGFKFPKMHISAKNQLLKGIHKNTSLPQKDAKIYSLLAV